MPEATPKTDRTKAALRAADTSRPYLHSAAMGALPAAAIVRAFDVKSRPAVALAIAAGAGIGAADKHLERRSKERKMKSVLKNYAAEQKMQKAADTDDRVVRHRAQLSDLFPTASADRESTSAFMERVEKQASIDTSHDEKAGISARPPYGTLSSSAEESNVAVINNLLNQLSGHTHEMHKATEAQLSGLFGHAGSSYGRARAIGRTASEAAGPISKAFSSR